MKGSFSTFILLFLSSNAYRSHRFINALSKDSTHPPIAGSTVLIPPGNLTEDCSKLRSDKKYDDAQEKYWDRMEKVKGGIELGGEVLGGIFGSIVISSYCFTGSKIIILLGKHFFISTGFYGGFGGMSVGSEIGGVIGDLVGGLFGGDDPLDDPREQVKHIEEEMAKQHYCVIQEIKLEIDEATEKILVNITKQLETLRDMNIYMREHFAIVEKKTDEILKDIETLNNRLLLVDYQNKVRTPLRAIGMFAYGYLTITEKWVPENQESLKRLCIDNSDNLLTVVENMRVKLTENCSPKSQIVDQKYWELFERLARKHSKTMDSLNDGEVEIIEKIFHKMYSIDYDDGLLLVDDSERKLLLTEPYQLSFDSNCTDGYLCDLKEVLTAMNHPSIREVESCLTDATINGCKNRTDCLADFYMSVAADIQIALDSVMPCAQTIALKRWPSSIYGELAKINDTFYKYVASKTVGVRQESDYMEMLDGVEDFSLFTNNTWKLFKNFGSPFYGKFIYMAQQTITNETLPDELSELYEVVTSCDLRPCSFCYAGKCDQYYRVLAMNRTQNSTTGENTDHRWELHYIPGRVDPQAGKCPTTNSSQVFRALQQYAYEPLIETVKRIDGLQTCNYIISKSSVSPDQPHLLQQAKATYGKEDRMWIDSKCFEDTCWSFYLFDLITAELPEPTTTVTAITSESPTDSPTAGIVTTNGVSRVPTQLSTLAASTIKVETTTTSVPPT